MIDELDYCYHCHTYRCGHASGTDEEFVQHAINVGVKNLGFSDHVMLPGINQERIRGNHLLQFDSYVDSVNFLKKKYKDQINIKLGFECEFFEGKLIDYYKQLLKEKGFDYLINGEHCFLNEDKQCVFYPALHDEKEALKKYKRNVIGAMKSGLFMYLAHPDFIMYGYSKVDEDLIKACEAIARASVRYNVPLELNCGSLRRDALTPGREDEDVTYPKRAIWEVFAKFNPKVVIGYDSHYPEDFEISKKKDLPYLFNFAKELNLNLISGEKLFAINRKKILKLSKGE